VTINIFQKVLKKTRDGWLGQAMSLFDRNKIDDAVWEELEELLIAADVGVSTATRLIETVRARAIEEKLSGEAAGNALREEMVRLLTLPPRADDHPEAKPRVYLVVGVNGSGKTTSIAKLAYKFKKDGKNVLLAAADTFRAAAIDQLKVQGQRVGVDVIAHQPGADPGAVTYDALQAAQNRGADILLVDTAGRLHTKFNLMEELKKVRRVTSKLDPTAPHEVILVLDATTGQNGLTQARHFAEAVGVTGIILAKLDGTAKGGIVLAISDELKLPIELIGTGEGLADLVPFNPAEFVEGLCS
jgi:fused signal recognition particle receptor